MDELMIHTLEQGGAQVGGRIHTLKEDTKLKYHECVRMMLDLGSQIETLKEHGWGLLYIDRQDITVTVDGSYILTPVEDLFSCDDRGRILIDRPFTYEETKMAPELKDITTLPSHVYYTCIYYSLKQLMLNVMGLDSIRQLYPTKLYFLMERCGELNPSDRIFVFI
jgi:hypothetical protein